MSVKERPILMSPPLVRATIDGGKTQTRRVVNPQPPSHHWEIYRDNPLAEFDLRLRLNGGLATWTPRWRVVKPPATPWHEDVPHGVMCPYGEPGDLLWVRETWATYWQQDAVAPRDLICADNPSRPGVWYLAEREPDEPVQAAIGRWRPSIHMPRWASRLTLRVEDVQVQQVRDITEADAIAEGVPVRYCCNGEDCDCRGAPIEDPRRQVADLWDSINAKRGYGWDANPWVWVVTYSVHEVTA